MSNKTEGFLSRHRWFSAGRAGQVGGGRAAGAPCPIRGWPAAPPRAGARARARPSPPGPGGGRRGARRRRRETRHEFLARMFWREFWRVRKAGARARAGVGGVGGGGATARARRAAKCRAECARPRAKGQAEEGQRGPGCEWRARRARGRRRRRPRRAAPPGARLCAGQVCCLLSRLTGRPPRFASTATRSTRWPRRPRATTCSRGSPRCPPPRSSWSKSGRTATWASGAWGGGHAAATPAAARPPRRQPQFRRLGVVVCRGRRHARQRRAPAQAAGRDRGARPGSADPVGPARWRTRTRA